MIVDENGDVSFRQSWLGNAENCPENGRRQLNEPDNDRTTSDAFIGTAAHYGIEKVVEGLCAPEDIGDAVLESYRTDPEAREIVFTRPKTHQADIAECIDLSTRCAEAWVRDIMPHAPLEGARTEVKFDVDLFEYHDRRVSIKGTCDLVPAEGPLWDWKTAGGSYRQKEKQKWALQPTVYAVADAFGGFGRFNERMPAEFVYGVMIKLKKQCRGEMLTVQRTANHQALLFQTLKDWIDMYEGMGIDGASWPKHMDGNYLCSGMWCPFYSTCRGEHITNDDDLYGWTPKK